MTMVDTDFQLGDIPDLTGVMDEPRAAAEPFADGWYAGTILAKREFTDKQGNERIFESGDDVAARSGRNIRLQVELTRASDGRKLNISTLVNYQPDDLTADSVKAVLAHKERVKEGEEWGTLFRPFMALNRLGKLQTIAGVRQFQRNGNGGLDLKPLYGKSAFFRIGPDNRNPLYKQVLDYQVVAPKKLL